MVIAIGIRITEQVVLFVHALACGRVTTVIRTLDMVIAILVNNGAFTTVRVTFPHLARIIRISGAFLGSKFAHPCFRITFVNRTRIVVITLNRFVFTIPRFRVTPIVSTRVAILAGFHLVFAFASGVVAPVVGTFVAVITTNRFVFAFTGGRVTNAHRAQVAGIAIFGRMDATGMFVTTVDCAGVIIITRVWHVFTFPVHAAVQCAPFAVIAIYWRVIAFARIRIAFVHGTGIVVRCTLHRLVHAVPRFRRAEIRGTQIIVTAILWYGDTFTRCRITGVIRTLVPVVTHLVLIHATALGRVTVFGGTCIVIVTIHGFCVTFARIRVTQVLGAGVAVITGFGLVDAVTCHGIAGIGGTFIPVIAGLFLEHAQPVVRVTEIPGTRIIVFTDPGFEHALARPRVTVIIRAVVEVLALYLVVQASADR